MEVSCVLRALLDVIVEGTGKVDEHFVLIETGQIRVKCDVSNWLCVTGFVVCTSTHV